MSNQNKLNLFDGTSNINWDTSVLNYDLVKSFIPISIPSFKSKIAYKFEFYTKGDILCAINGSVPILIGAGDEIELTDIWSFELLTSGVIYRYFASY